MNVLRPDSDDPPTAPGPPAAGGLASVSRHELDGVIVAVVRGEVDVSNTGQLERELTEISNQAVGLVIDLARVEYLDSAGIAMLYGVHLRLQRRGQRLVVVAPEGGAPRRVLELTAFEKLASLADGVDAAVAVARGTPGRS